MAAEDGAETSNLKKAMAEERGVAVKRTSVKLAGRDILQLVSISVESDSAGAQKISVQAICCHYI